MHEAQVAGPGRSHFATLTFEDDKLAELERECEEWWRADPVKRRPRPRASIWKRDAQLFMKRLRNRVGDGVRFFLSGEYGERGLRPHYHVALLNLELVDLEPWKKTGSGNVVYRSPLLEEAWPYGFAHVGTLTQQSAEYVARYCVKKVGGEFAAERYGRADPETGQLWQVEPEFGLMSKGLGAAWLEQFAGDCASGFLIMNGRKVPVPRYYRERLSDAVQLELKAKGKARAREVAHDNGDARLLVKHEVRELRAARLVRELED